MVSIPAGLAASASPLWRARPRVPWQIAAARVVPGRPGGGPGCDGVCDGFHGENHGKIWENHRKNHGKTMGKWRFTPWLGQNLEHGHIEII